MQRISSRSTFFFKSIVPSILKFTLLICLVFAFCKILVQLDLVYIIGIGMFLLFFTKSPGAFINNLGSYYELADEVWDCGDVLLVKCNKFEERINLQDIVSIHCTQFEHPQLVFLNVERTSFFKGMIKFIPKFAACSPFVVPDHIKKLEARINAVKSSKVESTLNNQSDE